MFFKRKYTTHMAIKRHSSFYPLVILLLFGCVPDTNDPGIEVGYRPVYGGEAASEITMLSARTLENPGKIYLYGKYLLVNEIKQGIHVFDNSDPASPAPVGFIQMLGNTDMAIKDNVLYADHLGNLVSLSLNDFQTLREEGRLPLRNWNLGVPPPAGFHFECVYASRGIVISWKKVFNQNFDCYALQ